MKLERINSLSNSPFEDTNFPNFQVLLIAYDHFIEKCTKQLLDEGMTDVSDPAKPVSGEMTLAFLSLQEFLLEKNLLTMRPLSK